MSAVFLKSVTVNRMNSILAFAHTCMCVCVCLKQYMLIEYHRNKMQETGKPGCLYEGELRG